MQLDSHVRVVALKSIWVRRCSILDNYLSSASHWLKKVTLVRATHKTYGF